MDESTFYVLVTGANSGLGYAICCRLIDEFLAIRPAHENLFLIFTTRSQVKSSDTAQRLQDYVNNVREHKIRRASLFKRGLVSGHLERGETNVDSPNNRAAKGDARESAGKPLKSFESEATKQSTVSRVTLRPEHVELTCIASVLELSSRLRASLPRLDVLICNAGTGGVLGIDWLKAARRVPFNFVKELTWPSFKIAAVGWLAEAQRRLKRDENGNGMEEREKSDTRDGKKGRSASSEDGGIEEKDPPLGMVFASNVLGHYVLGHEIASLMRRKWITKTHDEKDRTTLNIGSSSDKYHTDINIINSEHKPGLLNGNYKRSYTSQIHDSSGSGSRGHSCTLKTTGGPSHDASPDIGHTYSRNSNYSRIIWISSLEAYDHSLHFEGDKDNNVVPDNAIKTTASGQTDDIQGLMHPLAYESSKRLTDILVLTSELDSVRRSWVRKYFSLNDSVDNIDSTSMSTSDCTGSKNATENQPDTINAELSSGSTTYSNYLLPPRLYVAHPGICATSIVTLPFYLLELLMALSLYIARWMGSPWHTADAYTGAGAPVRIALAELDGNDKGLNSTIKWGSGTDRWGKVVIRKTHVEGWAGGSCSNDNDTNDRTFDSMMGAELASPNDKSLSLSLSTQSSQFEDLGWHCWREMEQMRVEWTERIR